MTDEEVHQALAAAREAGDLEAQRRWTSALMARAEDEHGDFSNISLGYREDLAELCIEAGDLAEAEGHYDYLVRHSAPRYGGDHHRTRRRQARLDEVRAARRRGGRVGRPGEAPAGGGGLSPQAERTLVAILGLVILACFVSLLRAQLEPAGPRHEPGSPAWVRQRRSELQRRDGPGAGRGRRAWWEAARARLELEETKGSPKQLRATRHQLLLQLPGPASTGAPRELAARAAAALLQELDPHRARKQLEALALAGRALGPRAGWPPAGAPSRETLGAILAAGRRRLLAGYPRTDGPRGRLPVGEALELMGPGEAGQVGRLLGEADRLAAAPAELDAAGWAKVEAPLRRAAALLGDLPRRGAAQLGRHLDRKLAWALAGQGAFREARDRLAATRAQVPDDPDTRMFRTVAGARSERPSRDQAMAKLAGDLAAARACLEGPAPP